jgi:hypothetical protein
MTLEPTRWKDSSDADELMRELLRAGRPSASLPPTARVRGERRIGKLAFAPVVVGIGLWSKIVAAAFGAGFAGALALMSVSPSLRQKLEGPAVTSPRDPTCVPGPAPKATAAPSAAPASPPAESPRTEAPSAKGDEEPALTPQSRGVPEKVAGGRPPAPDRPPETEPEATTGAPPPEGTLHLEGLETPAPESTARMPPEPPAEPGLSAEVGLLAKARAMVATDPNGALDLLNRHARSFQNGALAMEREVLVIEALARSGRAKEAQARARELLTASPGALYTARLTRVLGEGAR